MERVWFFSAAVLGFFSVALGAFAAHGLRNKLTPDMLAVFETGVRYQMYHALALIGVAWAATRWPGAWTTAAGVLFCVGILIFSGSLYVLAITGHRWLGAITPIGGVAFLVGWVVLAVSALK